MPGIDSTFEHIQDWRETQTQNKAQLWGLQPPEQTGAAQACTNSEGEMGKALTKITQLERSYRVITTVINLDGSQSITKDSARPCPHTLCLCITARAASKGLWRWNSRGAVGWEMGGERCPA